MEINEITIPVPWGHIAAKTWGSKNDPPVLSGHGLGDNAATFDLLIPKLPPTYYYVCVDLPGHGKSSRFPGNLLLNIYDYVLTYRLIVDRMGWRKFSLMGHSFGGQVAVHYLETYPDDVEQLVLLDAVYHIPTTPMMHLAGLRICIEGVLNANVTNNSRVYSREEVLDKLMKSRWNDSKITKEAAEVLASRGVAKDSSGKYKFINDLRNKYYMPPPGDEVFCAKAVREIAARCPVLLIVCTRGSNQFFLKPIVDEWIKKDNCTVKFVEKVHDVHLNEPELVAYIVADFLNRLRSKL